MGLDLRLIPYDSDFSHHVLSLTRDSELFDEIKKLPQMEIVKPIWSYIGYCDDIEENGGEIVTDKYDEPIKFTYAENIAKLITIGCVSKIQINKACLSFVSNLHPKTKIALYWC